MEEEKQKNNNQYEVFVNELQRNIARVDLAREEEEGEQRGV